MRIPPTIHVPTPRVYRSERGEVLAYHGEPWKRPMLCVEAYGKWYSLYLVMPDGSVERADLRGGEGRPSLEGMGEADEYRAGSVFGDHVYNPVYVRAWADACGWEMCGVSDEILIGRWLSEVLEYNRESLASWAKRIWDGE